MSSRAPIGYFAIPTNEYTTNQGCKSFRLNSQHNVEFHYYNFLFNINYFKRYGIGSTFAEISKSDIEKLSFIIPTSLAEQQKIARILSTVDAVIEKTEAAIAKYKAIKAGMMHDLFTNSEDAPIGWQKKQLKEIAQIKGGKRLPAGQELLESITPFPYLRVTDMVNGSIDDSNLKYVSEEIQPYIKNYTISKDDLYVTIAGTIGSFGSIPDKLHNAQLTENAAKITLLDFNENDKIFLKYYLSSNNIKAQINKEIGIGGGVPKLALHRIENFIVFLPDLAEQQKIAKILSTVDKSIENTQAEFNKYQKLKQGLMQDLLTGKVAVSV